MTSTEFTIGLDGESRSSSKVLRPPGGGSSDIFGMESAQNPAAKNQANPSSTQNRLFGGGDPTFTPGKRQIKTSMFEHQTPLAPPPPRKTFVRRNPITGEEIIMNPETCEKTEINGKEEINDNVHDNNVQEHNDGEDKAEEEAPPPKPVQTSIRVRNPPGGKSSGIF